MHKLSEIKTITLINFSFNLNSTALYLNKANLSNYYKTVQGKSNNHTLCPYPFRADFARLMIEWVVVDLFRILLDLGTTQPTCDREENIGITGY